MYTEKQLTCAECGTSFPFTVEEQERHAQLGFQNEPKRCPPCREAKRSAMGGRREMFEVICAECGKPAQVPFKPRGDRPVYCSDCFSQRR